MMPADQMDNCSMTGRPVEEALGSRFGGGRMRRLLSNPGAFRQFRWVAVLLRWQLPHRTSHFAISERTTPSDAQCANLDTGASFAARSR